MPDSMPVCMYLQLQLDPVLDTAPAAQPLTGIIHSSMAVVIVSDRM
jgi:hypothetical protein